MRVQIHTGRSLHVRDYRIEGLALRSIDDSRVGRYYQEARALEALVLFGADLSTEIDWGGLELEKTSAIHCRR